MSKRRITVGATAASLLAAAAITAGAIVPANADLAPQKKDVVGVGSDALQNAFDFLADGVKIGGKTYQGYNETAAAKKWRFDDIDASGDANGTATTDGTVVLRNGTSPVQRPYGGSQGLAALEADGANGKDADLIDFARATAALTATDESTAEANLGTHLDWVTLATDTDYIATTTTTHAPSVLTPAEILAIYTGKVKTWSDLAAYRAANEPTLPAYTPDSSWAGNTIVAFYPQNGAGMQKVFFSGLTAANNGTTPSATTLTNGIQVKQNDPTTLLDPSKAVNPATGVSLGLKSTQADDVIVPIPQSKYNLFKAGYYLDGSKPYSAASGSQSKLATTGWQLLTGSGSFTSTVQFDAVFRDKDFTSKAGWQPGSKLNWVKTLFWNPAYNPAKKKNKVAAPYAFSKTGQAILKALGLTVQPYATAFNSWTAAK